MVKETFVRLGESFTFECRHEQYRGCVYKYLGTNKIKGAYFKVEKLMTLKRQKYSILFWDFGPWETYQDYCLLEDKCFSIFPSFDAYELGTIVGGEFLLNPKKVKEFAQARTWNYLDDLERKKQDIERLKNIQFTQAV